MGGILSPDARLRIVTDLSVVAPGALLHTYVSGTPSTPLPTFSDSALTIPNANPIVASAGGLFGPIYLTPGVAYKFVLTDSAGGALWTQDPVNSSGTTPSEIDVRAYGAVGDGVTDDTLALQAALNAAIAGQTVRLWIGSYKITTGLVIPTSGVRLAGYGSRSSLVATLAADGAVVRAAALDHVEVSDLAISGLASYGVRYVTCTNSAVRRCTISGVTAIAVTDITAAISLHDCTDVDLAENVCAGNGAGASNTVASLDIYIAKSVTGCLRIRVWRNRCTSTLVTMHIGIEDSSHCQVHLNYCTGAVAKPNQLAWGYGIYCYNNTVATDYHHIHHNTIVTTQGTGIYLQSTRYTTVEANILRDVCQTELPTALAVGGIALNGPCDECRILGNFIQTVGQHAGIRADGLAPVILGNTVLGAPSGVLIGASAHGARVIGNRIQGCTSAGISHVVTGIGLTGVAISGNDVTTCGYGIAIDDFSQLTIAENHCHSNNLDGIVVTNADNLTIVGNQCYDNNQSLSIYAGIHITGCTDVVIQGNRCTNVVGMRQAYGLLTGTCTGFKVIGNVFTNNATADTSFTTTTAALTATAALTDLVLATGAGRTVDDVITKLQILGWVRQV